MLQIKVIKKLIFILFVFTTKLHSQTLEFKKYTTKEGLITDEIYNLHQDRHGYIWIFSKFGTLKYNGTEFKPVLKNLPIKEAFIFSIYENLKGQKWVANSNAKIYEIRDDSAFIIKGLENVSTSLKNSVSEITKLYVDDSLNIFAITKGHSYKFVRKNSIYFPIDLSPTLKPDSIRFRLIEVGSELLLLYNRFKNDEYLLRRGRRSSYLQLVKSKKIFRFPNLPYYFPFRSFKKFKNDIYFVYSNFLGKISEENVLSYIDVGSTITNYTKDKNNHIWVGCLNNGLFELNEHDSVINHYLENTTINDVLIDYNSGIWASTPLGLFHCADIKAKHFKGNTPLAMPISFLKKIEEKLFIANCVGDIFMVEKNQFKHIRKADNNTPLGIVKVKNEYIITFTMRIEKLNLSNNLMLETINAKSGNQYNVFLQGNDTLIFVWRRGINFYVNGSPKKEVDFGVKILASELDDNLLWFGTENGVYQSKPIFFKSSDKVNGVMIPDKEHLSQPKFLEPSKDNSVVKIVKSGLGNFWFCTHGNGLFELHKNKLVNYNTEEGLPSNIINSICFLDGNSVLLSTSKGLFISKLKVSGGIDYNWESLFLGDVQDAVLFEDKIYISTKNGLIIQNNEKGKKETKKTFLNLSSILVDMKEYTVKNFESTPSNQSNIEFKFDLITLTNSKPKIKFVLLGPTIDSGSVNNTVVKFNGLLPGNYTLSAFPIIKDGEKLKILLHFRITPTLWQTTLFQLLILVALVLIIIFLFRFILNHNRKKERTKTKNEQLILEYKLIALKAQINPHFMSNCLSAIQNLIVQNKTEKATFYIAKFGLMVRQILDFSSKSLITLDEELDLLRIYIELEQLRFENRFVFNIEIDKTIKLKETFLPPLILNPIVENAIWHGLLPIQNQKRAELHISVENENACLVLTIKDNGVGKGAKEKEINNGNTKSYGIKITEQRLSNINYLYKRNDSKMTIKNLYGEDGKPNGTLVTIYLPLNLTPWDHEED